MVKYKTHKNHWGNKVWKSNLKGKNVEFFAVCPVELIALNPARNAVVVLVESVSNPSAQNFLVHSHRRLFLVLVERTAVSGRILEIGLRLYYNAENTTLND